MQGVGREALRAAIALREAAESGGPVWILTHRNADPDAIASAYTVYWVLERLGAEACIGLPEGLSAASKRVVSALGVEIRECGEERPRSVVVVDASNTTQLGRLAGILDEPGLRIYLIDHHSPGDIAARAARSVIAEHASSTTQLVVLALPPLGARLSRREATLALAGIVYDTRRFQLVDPGALKASALLLEWGADYESVLRLLQARREGAEGLEYSERVARLKAAQRLVMGRACGDLIVVVSRVSAYESSAARALVELGADVAAVVGGKGGELRVALRLSRRALAAGLRGDELASYIAGKLGGKGGGHEAAALAHVRAPPGGAEEVAEALAKSLPGKVARICVERRSGRDGGGQS